MDLLERDHELSVLDDAIASVVAGGGGGVVVVCGEAGIGKTKLIRAFLAATDRRSLVGRCDELSVPVPLGPFLDYAQDAEEPLATDISAACRQIASLLASQPTVAVIEDLHWAGDATIDVLGYLARRIADLPVLLVVSTRAADDLGLARAVEGLSPDRLATIELPPLTRAGIEAMVEGTGHDAAEIHAESGGNPFLASELLAWERDSVPPRVALSSVARLSQVSSSARELARVLAVMPAGATWEMLVTLDPGAEARVAELERIHLLEADQRRVQYRHQLIRRGVEEAMAGAERRLCHRRVVDQLLKHDAEPAVIAHHAFEAGDWETLIEYASMSATSSVASGNYVDAVAQLERAAEHRSLLSIERQAGFAELFARALLPTGRESAGLGEALHAASLFESVGDLSGQARALTLASIPAYTQGDPDESLRLQRRALSIADGARDRDQTLATHASLAQTLALRSDWHQARIESERAVLEAEHGSISSRSMVLAIRSDIRRVLGDEAGGRTDWRAAFDLASADGDTNRLLTLHLNRVALSLGTLQIVELERELDEASSFMRNVDAPRSHRSLAGLEAAADLMAGRWDRVVDTVAPGGAIPVPTPTGTGPTLAAGLVAARRGTQVGVDAIVAAYDAAWPMRDIQRLGPIGAALAEMTWLGRLEDHAAVSSITELAHASGHQRHAGEMSLWCQRLGLDGPSPPPAAPEPLRLMFEGEWKRAVDWWDHHGCPYEALLAMAFAGDVDAMRNAAEVALGLGAELVADRIRRSLRDLGVSVGRGRSRAAIGHPLGLTRRQAEVLELVSQGLTNRAIADRMFITPKTVDHHIQAIYRTLGVNDRVAAATVWNSTDHPPR